MTKTYFIDRAHSIQSRSFKKGEVVGTGDIEEGRFTPAKGLESIVAIGHVIPRLADGRIAVMHGPSKRRPDNRQPEPSTKEDES